MVIDSRDAKVKRWLTAAHDGSHELAEQLLKENPKLITAVDDTYQRTALHWATESGQLKMMEFLLKESVDLTNAVDNEGKTALHWAASKRKRALAVPLLLAANPASLHARSIVRASAGFTPLDIAILSKDPVVILAQFFAADPSLVHRAVDSEGRTVLHLAAKHNCPTVAEHLLAMNPELIKAVDSHERTAFDIAVNCNSWEVAVRMMEEDPSLSRRGIFRGTTVLHSAASNCRDPKLVARILAQDPDLIDAVDIEGETALHSAVTGTGSSAIVRLLLSVASPQIINAVSRNDGTALHYAARFERFDLVELLLDVTSPDCLEEADREGRNVLHHAAHSGNGKLVSCLLAKSPDLIDVTCARNTVLHAGARHASIVEMVLALRPEMVHAVNGLGNTVLHSAIYADAPKELVERLLALSPSAVRVVNSKGETPLQVAVEWHHKVIAPLIMKLSLEEVLASSVVNTRNYKEELLFPYVEEQCKEMWSALNQDVVGVVEEYLGLDSLERRHQHKKQKVV